MSTTETVGTLPLEVGIPGGARVYMGLSGGLDSSYTAWRMLSMGYRMFFHCCEFRVPSGRHQHETQAQDAVLDWFISQGLRNFEVHRTSVDLGAFSGYLVSDDTRELPYLFWVMLMILEDHRTVDICHFVSPAGAHDGELSQAAVDEMNKMLETLVWRPIYGHVPKAAYSKADFLADMPSDLIERCWWCREPSGDEPCHKCQSCVIVDAAFDELGTDAGYN